MRIVRRDFPKHRFWKAEGLWFCGLEYGPFMAYAKGETPQEAFKAFRESPERCQGSRKAWLKLNRPGAVFGRVASSF